MKSTLKRSIMMSKIRTKNGVFSSTLFYLQFQMEFSGFETCLHTYNRNVKKFFLKPKSIYIRSYLQVLSFKKSWESGFDIKMVLCRQSKNDVNFLRGSPWIKRIRRKVQVHFVKFYPAKTSIQVQFQLYFEIVKVQSSKEKEFFYDFLPVVQINAETNMTDNKTKKMATNFQEQRPPRSF